MAPQPPSEPAARFRIPVCPTANNLFFNRMHGGRAKSSDYKRWLHDAGWAVKLQHPAPVPGIVRVLIEAPLHRQRDMDNAIKPTLDLLVRLALIVDDNLIDDLRIVRVAKGDEMTVSIWPMEAPCLPPLP